MPCCKNRIEALIQQVLSLLALCLLLTGSAWAAQVENIYWQENEDGLMLSAQMQFELPLAVENALRRSIPVYFVAQTTVLRERWYWTDAELLQARRYMRLSYQPLTRQWRLNHSSSPLSNQEHAASSIGMSASYDSYDDVLTAVKSIRDWKIADAQSLGKLRRQGADLLAFDFRLDTTKLPRTLQMEVRSHRDNWQLQLGKTLALTWP